MKIRKAVITAAGRGTRLFPATRAVQKEMLPLVDTDGLVKPTIQIIAAECAQVGIEEICIVVEKGGGQAFREHFRRFTVDEEKVFAGKETLYAAGKRLGELAERITYVEQPSPEGFGHAVYQAKDFAGGEPFVLLLGDHVYTTPESAPPCIAQVVRAAETSGGSITSVRLEPLRGVSITGIVQGRPTGDGSRYDIVRLQEKPSGDEVRALATPGLPADTYLGHFGIHLFTTDIFDCLRELIEKNRRVKNEFQLTSAQELLLRRAQSGSAPPYQALIVNGTRWDIGLPDEYLRTLAALGRRGPFSDALNTP